MSKSAGGCYISGVDAGGCYISGVDAGYKAILFEFEYRELK